MRATLLGVLGLAVCASAHAQPAGPAAGPPASADYAYHPSTGDPREPAAREPEPRRRTGPALGLKTGSFIGFGNVRSVCDPECSELPEPEGFNENASALFGLEFLTGTSRRVRYGLGFHYVPELVGRMNGQRYEFGSIFDTLFILERLFDVSPDLALAARGTLGLPLLFSSGDLERVHERRDTFCWQSGYECEADPGPYLGFEVSLGAGVLHSLRQLALRADVQLQLYTSQWNTVEFVDGEVYESAVALRPMLLVGVEL